MAKVIIADGRRFEINFLKLNAQSTVKLIPGQNVIQPVLKESIIQFSWHEAKWTGSGSGKTKLRQNSWQQVKSAKLS